MLAMELAEFLQACSLVSSVEVLLAGRLELLVVGRQVNLKTVLLLMLKEIEVFRGGPLVLDLLRLLLLLRFPYRCPFLLALKLLL